jgi:hypothetical protein
VCVCVFFFFFFHLQSIGLSDSGVYMVRFGCFGALTPTGLPLYASES